MKKLQLSGRKLLVFGGVFLFGVPAAAFFGGSSFVGSYFATPPSNLFAGEPCFPATITWSLNPSGTQREIRINPRGVLEDQYANTFLRCSDFANENRIVCVAGLPDGTVTYCSDLQGPHSLPGLDDHVYMVMNVANQGVDDCQIVIEKSYGEANPACRPSTNAPVINSNGSTAACNDQNLTIPAITPGQTKTVPANACIKLAQDRNWSSINPQLQAQQQDLSVYSVPFTATTCGVPSFSTGAFTGDWETRYLIDDNLNGSANSKCDVYVKFGGNGAKNFTFTYYD